MVCERVRERESERARERESERTREREKETERARESERARASESERARERQRDRETERQSESESESESERARERETERESERVCMYVYIYVCITGTFPVKTLGYKKLINVLQAFSDVVKVVGGGPGGVDVLPADEEGQGPAKRARLEPGVARHGVHGTGAQESANYNNGAQSVEDAYAQQYGFASAAHAYALAQADWSARAAACAGWTARNAATPFPQGGQPGSAQSSGAVSGAVPGFRDPYGSSGVQQAGAAVAPATATSTIQFDQHGWPAAQGNEHGAAHPGVSSAHPDWCAMEGWCAEQQAIMYPAVSLNSVTNSATNSAAAAGDWRQAAAATMHAYAHAQHAAAHAQSGAWSASAQHIQHAQLPYSSIGMAAMTGFTGGLTSANTSSS